MQFFHLKGEVIKQKDELFKHSFCRIDIELDNFYKKLYENKELMFITDYHSAEKLSDKLNRCYGIVLENRDSIPCLIKALKENIKNLLEIVLVFGDDETDSEIKKL
ncbi:MAG: hypothetical protein LBN19_01535 [Endomicrobium sp.]|nr:hypothetical protein [Endomicrobium sp.]